MLPAIQQPSTCSSQAFTCLNKAFKVAPFSLLGLTLTAATALSIPAAYSDLKTQKTIIAELLAIAFCDGARHVQDGIATKLTRDRVKNKISFASSLINNTQNRIPSINGLYTEVVNKIDGNCKDLCRQILEGLPFPAIGSIICCGMALQFWSEGIHQICGPLAISAAGLFAISQLQHSVCMKDLESSIRADLKEGIRKVILKKKQAVKRQEQSALETKAEVVLNVPSQDPNSGILLYG